MGTEQIYSHRFFDNKLNNHPKTKPEDNLQVGATNNRENREKKPH